MPGHSRWRRALLAPALGCCLGAPAPARAADIRIVADGVPEPLTRSADPVRGRAVALSREAGCTLCHQLPAAPGEPPPLGGDIGPPLAGTGSRWSVAQLRLRLIDSSRVNSGTVMPGYYRTEGLTRVAANLAGRTVLDAQQVEDVVAWLSNLR